MNDTVFITIAALLSTSFIVRILPAIHGFQLPEAMMQWAESILPTAVFLNFIAYIFIQEIKVSVLAASVSLVITALIAFFKAGGLMLGMTGGCVSYYLIAAHLNQITF